MAAAKYVMWYTSSKLGQFYKAGRGLFEFVKIFGWENADQFSVLLEVEIISVITLFVVIRHMQEFPNMHENKYCKKKYHGLQATLKLRPPW